MLATSIVGLLTFTGAAQAVPVIPNVSNITATAVTSGLVPDPDPGSFLGALLTDALPAVENGATAVVADSVSSIPTGGAETSEGAANATVDTSDFFGGSSYGASSEVRSSDSGTATTGLSNMRNLSFASLDAVLDTVGLIGPGDTGTVDAVLNLTGSLIYDDPTGAASAIQVPDPFDPRIIDVVPDMEASVSIAFLIADNVDAASADPNNPPLASVFSGSATLVSILGGGTPTLSTEGDLSASDFTQNGVCDAFFCQFDIDLSVPFSDIQSLGFGDTFEVGLLLLTSVEGVSANTGTAGRRLVSDFDDTASFSVSVDVQQASAVPAPASAALLLLGLVLIGARRRGGAGSGAA